MDLFDRKTLNRLCLRHNQSVSTSFGMLKTNEKRKLFALLRKTNPPHMNFLLPFHHGLTIGEFATAAIMQSDLARRRKRQFVDNSAIEQPAYLEFGGEGVE